MAIKQFTRHAWDVLLVGALLVWSLGTGSAAQAQLKPADQKPTDRAADLKTLLKERRDLLQDVVKLLMKQYQEGVGDLTRVGQAQRELLKASLDLAGNAQERRAALKEFLEFAEQFAKLTEQRFRVGTSSTKVDVLQAQAMVREARIELLREEMKDKPRK